MKVCPHCHETYQHHVEFCFDDGEVLVFAHEAAFATSVAPGMDAPAPPRRPVPAASIGATPVPRSRASRPPGRADAPAYGSSADAPPAPAASGSQADDEDAAPLPPSMVETAPMPRPPPRGASGADTPKVPVPRAQPTPNAQSPLAQAETPVVDIRREGSPPARNAPPLTPEGAAARPDPLRADAMRPIVPPAGPRPQLLNTMPRVQTYASEVVEPESNGMLMVGIGALVVGAALLVGSVALLAGFFIGGSEKGPNPPPQDGSLAAPRPVLPVPPPAPEIQPELVPPVVPDPTEGQVPAPLPPPVPPVVPDPVPAVPDRPDRGGDAPAAVGPRPAPPSPAPPSPAPREPEPAPAPASSGVTVHVTANVSGAPVQIAGRSLRTPFDVQLAPGDYTWTVSGGGFKPTAGTLSVGPETRELEIKVDREVNHCLVVYEGGAGQPAEVQVDGKRVDLFSKTYLPIGTVEFALRFDDGTTSSQVHDVPPTSSGNCVVKLR